jgi:hypothetical protein
MRRCPTLPGSIWKASPDRKQPDIAGKRCAARPRSLGVAAGRGRLHRAAPAPQHGLDLRPVNKILFSSDMFTHVWSDEIAGPWLMEGDDGVTSNAFVRSFLLGTGFWWLEGARSDPLRKGVRRVFETYDIEMICPGYGAMLKGRELVKKQFDVLDAVLADLDRSKVRAATSREPARRISEGAP